MQNKLVVKEVVEVLQPRCSVDRPPSSVIKELPVMLPVQLLVLSRKIQQEEMSQLKRRKRSATRRKRTRAVVLLQLKTKRKRSELMTTRSKYH